VIPDRDKKTILVGDTSALLSLEMGSILNSSFRIFDYMIPSSVNSELNDISIIDDDHGKASIRIIDYVKRGQIHLLEVKDRDLVTNMVNDHTTIDIGEAEALVLAQENDVDILITDDLRSLGALRKKAKGVRIHLSVYVMSRMVISKDIGKEDAYKALEKISLARSWENAAIYRKAMDYIKDL
jgi:predicted nucleic acid-binding protein